MKLTIPKFWKIEEQAKLRSYLYPKLFGSPIGNWLYFYPIVRISVVDDDVTEYNLIVREVGSDGMHISAALNRLTEITDNEPTIIEDWAVMKHPKLNRSKRPVVKISLNGELVEAGEDDVPL